ARVRRGIRPALEHSAVSTRSARHRTQQRRERTLRGRDVQLGRPAARAPDHGGRRRDRPRAFVHAGAPRRESVGTAAAASRGRTYLALGRVSNLPTVWTNVVAGIALAGGSFTRQMAIRLGIAASLFYVGGMFLNDAFDRGIDARERPERPIPSGRISA